MTTTPAPSSRNSPARPPPPWGATWVEMKPAGAGKTRIVAHVPSRGLIGYHGEFLTTTRGSGVLNRVFHDWAPHKGPIPGRRAGVADLDGKRPVGGLLRSSTSRIRAACSSARRPMSTRA